mmetsp:Transcript_43426/g.86158  ORF Transcript_43426/g.86158 Transcript_43426/m.86158 type:complete len:544 (-) Transcript_43426:239-1870(-)
MDLIADTATVVVRQSASVLQVAAGELAKQASTVADLAQANDTVTWLAGEGDCATDFREEDRPIAPTAMPVAALQPWGSDWRCRPPMYAQDACANETKRLPFAHDAEINGKVFLWQGDICAVEVDALLVPVAAGFAEGHSTIYPRILKLGGRDLKADISHLDSCRSGEVRFTKAYGLPCNRLVITVGPKFKEQYRVAAQNTLNACCRECIQGLVEAEMRTVAIPCIWYKEGYPREEHALVVLRTIRRCLEKLRTNIDSVVLVAACPAELGVYESLMPLYFPRSLDEAIMSATADLPEGAWTEWGEVFVEERRIRLSSCLISRDDNEDSSGEEMTPMFSPSDDADKSFLSARDDADTAARKRLEGTIIEAETPEMAKHACLRYLRRAWEVQAELVTNRFVFSAVQDHFGRKVVVLLGARLPPLGVRDERTLPLFVKELELLRSQQFVLLYVNSDVSAFDTPKLEVFREMLAVISMKYRNSLAQVLVLHPGLGFRAAFALGSAVSDTAASIWNDTVYFERLAQLASFVSITELQLPAYVQAFESFI